MSYEIDRAESGDSQDGEPSLTDMATAAVDHLKSISDDDGFFLMVESGRIDHGHHATNAKRALEEAVEMDRAVEVKKILQLSSNTSLIIAHFKGCAG